MAKVIVHRGTGSIIDVQDDLWVIDDSHVDEATGDIDDDVLLAHGKPVIDVVPDYGY